MSGLWLLLLPELGLAAFGVIHIVRRLSRDGWNLVSRYERPDYTGTAWSGYRVSSSNAEPTENTQPLA